MTGARAALTRNLRAFFDLHLCGVLPWSQAILHEPEDAPDIKTRHGNRRNPTGRHVERVTVTVGGFRITAESPEQSPPLGLVSVVSTRTGETFEGPIDETTWAGAAQFIKGKKQ